MDLSFEKNVKLQKNVKLEKTNRKSDLYIYDLEPIWYFKYYILQGLLPILQNTV